MISNKSLLLSLVVSGCAAVVYSIVRRTRNLETRQFDKDLNTWESEGGNLLPSGALIAPGPVATADKNKRE